MSATKLELTDALTAMLHELLPLGDGAAPAQVLCWRHSNGAFNRIRADYPNGWQLIVNFSRSRRDQVTSVKGVMPPIKIRGRA